MHPVLVGILIDSIEISPTWSHEMIDKKQRHKYKAMNNVVFWGEKEAEK